MCTQKSAKLLQRQKKPDHVQGRSAGLSTPFIHFNALVVLVCNDKVLLLFNLIVVLDFECCPQMAALIPHFIETTFIEAT